MSIRSRFSTTKKRNKYHNEIQVNMRTLQVFIRISQDWHG